MAVRQYPNLATDLRGAEFIPRVSANIKDSRNKFRAPHFKIGHYRLSDQVPIREVGRNFHTKITGEGIGDVERDDREVGLIARVVLCPETFKRSFIIGRSASISSPPRFGSEHAIFRKFASNEHALCHS